MTQTTERAAGHAVQRVRTEPNHRRVRVFFGGQAVADSTRTLYLFETGHLPVYYFPRDDVRSDLLEKTGHHTHCPYKGDAEYYSVIIDGRQVAENAVWAYPVPPDRADRGHHCLPGSPETRRPPSPPSRLKPCGKIKGNCSPNAPWSLPPVCHLPVCGSTGLDLKS